MSFNKRFINLIHNFDQIQEDDAIFLKEIKKSYPYCQIAHLLYLKSKLGDSINQERKAQILSLYMPNKNYAKAILNDQIYYLTSFLTAHTQKSNLQKYKSKMDAEIPSEGAKKKVKKNPKTLPNEIPKSTKEENNKSVEINKKEMNKENSDEDLANSSTQWSNNLATKSLAKLLEKQGKISEVIQVYEKLILKEPQHKSKYQQKIQHLKNNFT